MKRFSDYYRIREDNQGLGDIDAMPNEDELLLKIAKLAINRHTPQLLDFFKTLSKNDDDIKRALGELRDKHNNLPKDMKPRRDDNDVVVPSLADGNGPI